MSKKEKNIKIEGEELELNNEETTQNGAEAQAEYANGEETPTEEELDPLVAAQNEAEQWKDKYIRLVAEYKTEDPQAIKEGYELIYKKFLKALETLGVHKIETDDADFDVDYHEAIAMVPGMGDDKKGKVIDCVQTGYTLNDKVIRHAKVAVGQ